MEVAFLQIIIAGIVLVYLDGAARDIALAVTSFGLLVMMAYMIYKAMQQPPREERVAASLAARSET